ncbi:MAG: hypothetical protein ABIG87_02870 [Patescibacteria group bacterium]
MKKENNSKISKKEKFTTEAYLDKALDKFACVVKSGFDAVDKRFEQVDKRHLSLEARMEEGFLSIHQELSTLGRELLEIHNRVDILEEKIDRLIKAENEDVIVLNNDIRELKARVFVLEKQIKCVKHIS